jgi:hypothetical protein
MSSGVPWLWLTWDSIASRGGTAQAQASPEEAFKIARISCFGAFSRLLRAFESLDVGKVLFARCGPLVLEQRSPPDHRNRVAIELEVRAVGDGLVEGYRLRDSRCRSTRRHSHLEHTVVRRKVCFANSNAERGAPNAAKAL